MNARSVIVSADNTRAGQVWCATIGNGLQKVVLDDQFGTIVSRFDVEQGLPSQKVFAVLSERGSDGSESVIAGTNRGLVRYEPGRVMPTVLPARIISQRIHEQQELRSGLAARLSAEQFAAGCHGDQQPYISRAVSICIRAV